MDDSRLNVGDEVYIYHGDLFKSLTECKLIKGKIISEEYYDYGYHGSGDWIWDYIVKGIDGKEYYANHGYGYKPYKIVTYEEANNYLDEILKERVKKSSGRQKKKGTR